MILFHAFGRYVWRVDGRMGAETLPEVLDGLGQFGLVILDRQHVVGSAFLNRLGNGGLGAHGVNRDRTAAQSQVGKQLGNGRDLALDFSAVARCPSTRPAPAAKAETRCSAVASTPPERRLVLPSMATISAPSAGKMLLTQRRKADSNCSGSINPKMRPNVSCDGMPCSNRK